MDLNKWIEKEQILLKNEHDAMKKYVQTASETIKRVRLNFLPKFSSLIHSSIRLKGTLLSSPRCLRNMASKGIARDQSPSVLIKSPKSYRTDS